MGKRRLIMPPTSQILTKPTGFMDAYDFTLNPYSGCSFGRAYCYATFFSRDAAKRDSWGHWVSVKENAVALLAKRKPGYLNGKLIYYMSSVTDSYQPIERQPELTRRLLAIMAERHRSRLVVQTRSPLVARDCDLFRRIEDNGGQVQVNMTVTLTTRTSAASLNPSARPTPAGWRPSKKCKPPALMLVSQ